MREWLFVYLYIAVLEFAEVNVLVWSAGCLVSICQIICILNRDFF